MYILLEVTKHRRFIHVIQCKLNKPIAIRYYLIKLDHWPKDGIKYSTCNRKQAHVHCMTTPYFSLLKNFSKLYDSAFGYLKQTAPKYMYKDTRIQILYSQISDSLWALHKVNM